jgi:acetyl esterase
MKSIHVFISIILLSAAVAFAEDKMDIEYGNAGGQSLLLDAHVPDGPGPFPVVIVLHGGGWNSGGKRKDVTPLFDALSKANFTWFTVDYRLSPTNRWPACFEDVQTAIRWVKAHAGEYKGDPHRVALLGYSAGGHLACLAAVLAKPDTQVQAVVGCAPPTDLVADTVQRGGLSQSLQTLFGKDKVDDEVRAILKEDSPITYVKPGLPPFYLIHGDADKSVAYDQSVQFHAKLRENGDACELITIKGAKHKIVEWEKIDPDYKVRMTDWLTQTLGAVPSNHPPTHVFSPDAKVKIVLVGDSTVNDRTGWGFGFKQFLTNGAQCINTAAGGRSSKSFITENRWTQALALKGDYYLIQFGHNDEPGKGERSTDPTTTYRGFMTRYVDEARAIGAKPILVTSLVRRQFDKSGSGKINSSLVPYVDVVKAIAAEKNVPLIDLHARSKELCEKLGKEGCLFFSPTKMVEAQTRWITRTSTRRAASSSRGWLLRNCARPCLSWHNIYGTNPT